MIITTESNSSSIDHLLPKKSSSLLENLINDTISKAEVIASDIIVAKVGLGEENKNNEAIIEYFKYDNMKKNEPDFCPLYNLNKKCHEMEDLNCYLCACSYFRFNDKGSYHLNYSLLFFQTALQSCINHRFESNKLLCYS